MLMLSNESIGMRYVYESIGMKYIFLKLSLYLKEVFKSSFHKVKDRCCFSPLMFFITHSFQLKCVTLVCFIIQCDSQFVENHESLASE